MATWDGYNQSIIANRFQKSFMVNYVDLSGRLLVRQDASFNNRLFVMNDASFMGNVYVDDILTANFKFDYSRDASYNNRLFVQNDASFMGNVYIDDNLTTNLRLVSIRDTSLNSNVVVGRDISCNGNINIGRNITVLGNLAVKNYTATNVINTTTTNYSLAVVEDISLNGRVSVSRDASLNGNLFVSRDISLNGNVSSSVSIVKDISVNGMKIGKGANNAPYTTYLGNTAALGLESNTAMGYQSLNSLVSGVRNTALGYQALYSTTNDQNTAVGYQSLRSTTSGTTNVAIGYQSGYNNTTGSYNTYIGYGADASAGTYTVSTAVGANSSITGNSQIVLGRPTETVIIPRILGYSTPPLWIRTANGAQTFTNNSSSGVDWSTENYKSPYMPLTYASNTFTNSSGSIISVYVTAGYNFTINGAGQRGLWICRNGEKDRICMALCAASDQDSTGVVVSGNFYLNNGETFHVRAYQSSGVTLGPNTSYFNNHHPCRIMITIY
jgi:hypothetical protein